MVIIILVVRLVTSDFIYHIYQFCSITNLKIPKTPGLHSYIMHMVEPLGERFGFQFRFFWLFVHNYFGFRFSYTFDYNAYDEGLFPETRVQHIEICNTDMTGIFVFKLKSETKVPTKS